MHTEGGLGRDRLLDATDDEAAGPAEAYQAVGHSIRSPRASVSAHDVAPEADGCVGEPARGNGMGGRIEPAPRATAAC